MNTVTQSTTPTVEPDFAAIKSKQQAAWSAGDYAVVGSTLQLVGEQLCEAVDVRAGARLLDVAGGNGNVALAAARRFAQVTCTDYVPALLDRAAQRATADGLTMDFRVADVEDLPFADASFDYVVSTFGAMFAPDHVSTARELARVCRPGGRIGLANWTPDSFIGGLFKTLGRYVAPPAGVVSPAQWGNPEYLRTLFPQVQSLRCHSRNFNLRYASGEHWLQLWREVYGPLQKAFDSLHEAADAAGQAALSRDLLALVDAHNVAEDGTMVVPSEYLEIVITR